MTTKIADITTLTLSELRDVYNAVSEQKITKFSDKTKGQARVSQALEAADMQLWVGQVQGANQVPGHDFWLRVSSHVEAPKKTSSRAIFGEHEVIEHNAGILRDENDAPVFVNPKRKGSKAHARFQIICDRVSLTVGEYLDACVELEGDEAEERFKYRRDIAWDIEHGHITFPNGAEE